MPVVLLTQDSELGRVTANYLGKCFDGLITVFEEPVSPSALVRSRRKRLGTVVVAGQLAFTAFRRLQRYYSAGRVADIKRAFELDDGQIQTPIERVPSVNSNVCRALLRQLAPRVLLVMGTRIIGNETLHALYAPFVNYHAGITPKYRGVHGAYWALVEGDTEHCGVSVHLIDAGIDTGPVLYQARIAPTGADNFSTYPFLQIAAGLPLLARAAKDALDGCLRPRAVDLPSGLWSHPTLWSYCAKGLGCGVW
jgi:phosphoribosylglycinamide formyltransferase-1